MPENVILVAPHTHRDSRDAVFIALELDVAGGQ